MIYLAITFVVCAAMMAGLFILVINTLAREQQNEEEDGDESDGI